MKLEAKATCWVTLLVVACAASPANSEEVNFDSPSRWHRKFKWEAASYFSQPLDIALCNAIEARDVQEVDRLVVEGANVNASGKGGVSPLLWAFPDKNILVFKKLLELGADPNVLLTTDVPGLRRGDSVTHLSCQTRFAEYFDLVFSHRGDPNLQHGSNYDTPLLALIKGAATEKQRKVARLFGIGR